MIEEVVSMVRREGGSLMRTAIAGSERLSTSELASAEDPGLFGPDSVAWRVHSDSSMLIGGLRALLLQTLHPLTMAGVADHSDYRDDPWGRLHRTGRFIGATTFGTTESAEAGIARVRSIHDRVVGTSPDGRPYSANDPHLLTWVHITEVDSFLAAYDRYGSGQLTNADRDAYVAEMSQVAIRLGADGVPMNRQELAACLQAYRPECEYGDQAKEAVRFLLVPPVALWLRGAYGLISAASIGLLPSWSRRQLRLPLLPLADPVMIRPAATLLTRTIGWLLEEEATRNRVDQPTSA